MISSRVESALLAAGLTVLFVVLLFAGEHPPHPTAIVVRPAVIVSGAFWLLAAVIPLLRRSDLNIAAISNSIAASTAVYAGLAALH